MRLFNKTFQVIFLLILLAEFLSFCAYTTPWINTLSFFVVTFLVLIASIYKLEFGFLAVLTELLIGSKGYLFYFDFNEKTISIRIAIWAMVILIWSVRTLLTAIKNKKTIFNWRGSSSFFYFLSFFIFIFLALINGQINHNSPSSIFFDFNGWLYLALIFPAYDLIIARKREITQNVLRMFLAATIWLAFKTLVLVFLFSHDIGDIIFVIYRWIRTTGVGEVTLIQGGFYRVFFQSHVYLLISFLLALIALSGNHLLEKIKIKKLKKKNIFIVCYCFFVMIFSVNLINFSRSNWLGLTAAIFLLFLILIITKNWQQLLKVFWILSSGLVLSALLIVAIVNFPLFNPIGGFKTTQLLSDRATAFNNEAGASSRWALLPELWKEIVKQPLFGQGFGATVTYRTSDPRILENNPSGLYTTYAFEWGWLDIWLKLGFVGLLSYLALLFKIYFFDVYKILKLTTKEPPNLLNDANNVTVIVLSLGMVTLMVVSIFSPYLNHPLGFGYLVISSVFIEKIKNDVNILKS